MKHTQFTLIYLSPGSWYRDFHRKPLVREFAKHSGINKTYVIEIPSDLIHAPIKNPKRLFHALKSFFKVSKVEEKIYVFTPLIFLHQLVAYKFPIFRRMNRYLFNKSMQRLCKKEQIENNIVLSVFRPEMTDFTHFHSQMTLIYDCYDEYLLTSQDKEIKNLDKLEIELMLKSDLIFTTSQKLLDKSLKYNKNSYLLHNAADTDLFRKAYLEDLDLPKDLVNIKRPIIGYVGALRDWQDFELLEYLFKNNPNMNFVFIGHNRKTAIQKGKDFEKFENVHFLGQKRFEDVPTYIKHLDVAIIPNRMTLFNQNVVPYKLFEYLAAGKKILSTNHSTDLSAYFADYVEKADNKIDFSKKLNEMIDNNDINLQKIFEFGQKQSWKNRVEIMIKHITNLNN